MSIHISKNKIRATGSDANALMIAFTPTEKLFEMQKDKTGSDEFQRLVIEAIEARRKEWVEQVYQLLCKSQGAPEDANEEKNLRDWAELLSNGENAMFQEGMTPLEAHNEELSAAQ